MSKIVLNEETGEEKELPEYLFLRPENQTEIPQEISMRKNKKTGTRYYAVFGKIIINGERCTVQARFYVDKSKFSDDPWWWESKKSLSELGLRDKIQEKVKKKKIEGGDVTEIGPDD